MAKQYINIQYPFQNSIKGFFVSLTETDQDAIKSDLMHLILTPKGSRFYMPEFGTNLIKFIFEPNDGLTETGIKEGITDAVKKYLPNLKIDNVVIDVLDIKDMEYTATIRIHYTITDDVFTSSDFITINI
jgi:phage baseplate assembly protein W